MVLGIVKALSKKLVLVLSIVEASLEILGIGIGVKSGIAQVCCTPNILFLRKVGVF